MIFSKSKGYSVYKSLMRKSSKAMRVTLDDRIVAFIELKNLTLRLEFDESYICLKREDNILIDELLEKIPTENDITLFKTGNLEKLEVFYNLYNT